MSEPTRNHLARWPADSTAAIFLGRVVSRLSEDDLWSGLCSGELAARVYCVGRTDFWPIDLSPLEFLKADRGQVFAKYQIEVRETDWRRPAAIRRRIPVPHWLYVTRASLDTFEKAKPSTTVAAEKRATAHLKSLLEGDKDMLKSKAREACKQFRVSGQGFDDRVWPDARELAGLPREAKAGRKSSRKSSR